MKLYRNVGWFGRWFGLVGIAFGACNCQSYDFVFIPDSDRQGTHLRFAVQTPSKADILFVIDNSKSMREEQEALLEAFDTLLNTLAPADTSYRIGLVSTDAVGYTADCNNVTWSERDPPLGPDLIPGGFASKGDCTAGLSESERPVLRRPHDGAAGRLVAAFVPEIFDATKANLNSEQRAVLNTLYPTAVDDGPPSVTGARGVPWVIDRDIIQADACGACGCGICEKGSACFDNCAAPVATQLVRSYFESNLAALSIYGSGYEQGLLAGSLALGIDPRESEDHLALNPGQSLTRLNAPNSYVGLNDDGQPQLQSWLREEALTAIMFLSDEEDCSMPSHVFADAGTPKPEGSYCYRDQFQTQLLNVGRMSKLIETKKGNINRVAVGFIGGLRKGGAAHDDRRSANSVSCVVGDEGTPDLGCSCMFPGVGPEGETLPADERWCTVLQSNEYTNNPATCSTNPADQAPCCHALSGKRYINFTSRFRRKTFESICRERTPACNASDPSTTRFCGFGPAIADFANIALLACFDLDPHARPARDDPRHIQVKRVSREDALAGIEPTLLPQREPGDPELGWYYETESADIARICLTGVDRLIGDVYDIFVLTTDRVDYIPQAPGGDTTEDTGLAE